MSIPTPADWCSQSQASAPPADPARDPNRQRPITPSSLCSMGWRRLLITGLIRDRLTGHFAEPAGIEEPDLRHLVWRESERTGILIESITRWRGELVEKRPAVIIKPNKRHNIRWGIGDAAGATEQGNRLYQTFWAGSHTLFCIHGSGASADILATEVERDMGEFHPVITAYLGLYNWQVTEVGEPAELEEARESWVVPVTVAWIYTAMWEVRLEALKLRKVPLGVLLDGALVQ